MTDATPQDQQRADKMTALRVLKSIKAHGFPRKACESHDCGQSELDAIAAALAAVRAESAAKIETAKFDAMW